MKKTYGSTLHVRWDDQEVFEYFEAQAVWKPSFILYYLLLKLSFAFLTVELTTGLLSKRNFRQKLGRIQYSLKYGTSISPLKFRNLSAIKEASAIWQSFLLEIRFHRKRQEPLPLCKLLRSALKRNHRQEDCISILFGDCWFSVLFMQNFGGWFTMWYKRLEYAASWP